MNGEYSVGHQPRIKNTCPVLSLHYCGCGCGALVKSQYKKGHNQRVSHNSMSEMAIDKIRKLGKLRYIEDPKVRSILKSGRAKPRLWTSEDAVKRWENEEYRIKQRAAYRAFLESPEGQQYRKWLSEKKKQSWVDPSHTYNSLTYRQKVSVGRKKQWENPETVRRFMVSNRAKPNGQERLLDGMINSITDEFAYNGDASQGVVVGGKVPDFVNVNGKKQVIELFGDWYGQKKTGFTEGESEERLKLVYDKFGFDCLIIWERELKDANRLITKIREFLCKECTCL